MNYYVMEINTQMVIDSIFDFKYQIGIRRKQQCPPIKKKRL